MKCKIKTKDDSTVCTLQGKIGTKEADEFAAKYLPQLIDNAGGTILFKCEDLEFISSSWLRKLLTLAKNVADKGGKVTLSGIRPELREVLDVTGFTTIVEIV
ncbi:MAG: STAS domain-containing protein [Bacteroidales bacterium]|nr:STAS domain-containing protein [Candidatus Cacconaster merdequi]